MKKNGEFVGVDEKFIPENEKYVDESILGDKEQITKKTKKMFKGIGIGYLCFIILIFVLAIGMPIFIILGNDFTINKLIPEKGNKYTFDYLQGTNYGHTISDSLDDIVMNNKLNGYTSITVVYNGKSATTEEEVISIKSLLDDWTKYECLLDYKSNDTVNKVTIRDI